MSDPPTDPNRGTGSDTDDWTDGDRRPDDTGGRAADGDRHDADAVGSSADTDRHRPDSDPSSTGSDRRPSERTKPANTDPEQGRVDTDEKGRACTDSDALKWLSGVVSLIGLWIAVSPFLYETAQVSRWNNLVTGGAICLLAGYGFYRMSTGHRPDVGSTSLASLLGLWAIAAPFLLTYGSDALVWGTMASGIAVAILSGYNAYESRRTDAPRGSRARA